MKENLETESWWVLLPVRILSFGSTGGVGGVDNADRFCKIKKSRKSERGTEAVTRGLTDVQSDW